MRARDHPSIAERSLQPRHGLGIGEPNLSFSAVLESRRTAMWRRKRLRQVVQTVRVAPRLDPAPGFVLGVLRNSPARSYRVRRSGLTVHLRPRTDLQVARELISKNIYEPPREVLTALKAIPTPLTVLDLGANIGLFALSILHALGGHARVVAVEPDPTNIPLLRANIVANGYGDRTVVHQVAAGSRNGKVAFRPGQAEVSHVLPNGEAIVGSIEVPLVDVFSLAGGCDLIKVDIEGSEWEILRDPRMRELDAVALVVEWHAPSHAGRSPAAEAVGLLRDAGFRTLEVSSSPPVGMVWAWRA